MAYIKKKSERKFKITVCNGYKVNGQKRMKAQTITVPSSVPKRGVQQYVMAEAERIEKKFKYGVKESDQTHFEQYAENWLKRQQPFFKATTYAGYKRNLGIVYPLIGGIPLAKLLPMTLEEMCEELRKRPGRSGSSACRAGSWASRLCSMRSGSALRACRTTACRSGSCPMPARGSRRCVRIRNGGRRICCRRSGTRRSI